MGNTDNYHVFGLRETEMDYFRHLLPEGESYTSNKGFFLLGAADDEYEPRGILVYELRDGAYFVRYLYVDPDHRRCGVGTLLIQKMLWSFYQMKQVHPCYIEYTDDDETIGPFMEAQANFITGVSGRVWVISPDSRRKMDDYAKLTEMDTNAVPFFSLSGDVQKEFLDSQLASGYRFLSDDHAQTASYDKELCLATVKDDHIRSAIFAEKNVYDHIELSYLYAEKMNPLSIRGVLAAFLQAVENMYPDETIELSTVNAASERLISGLFESVELDNSDIISAEWDYSLKYTE